MELFPVIKRIGTLKKLASQIEHADIVQVPLFNGRHELMDSVFLWQSGNKYRVKAHDADMNDVEAMYGQTDSGMTVIEGIYS